MQQWKYGYSKCVILYIAFTFIACKSEIHAYDIYRISSLPNVYEQVVHNQYNSVCSLWIILYVNTIVLAKRICCLKIKFNLTVFSYFHLWWSFWQDGKSICICGIFWSHSFAFCLSSPTFHQIYTHTYIVSWSNVHIMGLWGREM